MPNASLRSLLLFVAAALALVTGCTIPPLTPLPPNLHSPYTGYESALYRDDHNWLCRPDLPGNYCDADLSATEIHADGSRTVLPHVPAPHPEVDCFYVYPTVDLDIFPGNHTDFDDLGAIEKTTLAQAARFSEVCSVYVPLYRQITIGSYVWGAKQRDARLDVAFSDVEDAFIHYMGQYNHGRKVVLIGHSQGAEMVVRLLQRLFDQDPVMRERLLLAMPIGGQVEVPKGRTTGGTFATIPICTDPDQLGCVVAYRSYRAGAKVSPAADWMPKVAGNETVCVNPAGVGAPGPHPFSRAYLAPDGWGLGFPGIGALTTPFVVLRDFYAGECVEGPPGYGVLAVTTTPSAGDARSSVLPLDGLLLNTAFGLHVLDLQLPQGDLISLVGRKAGRLRR